MDQVLIRPNRGQHALLLIGGGAILLGHAWLSGFQGVLSIIELIVFFVIVAPVLVWQVLDRRPRIVADTRGVSGSRLGDEVIPWSQIQAVDLVRTGGLEHVCIDWVRPGQDLKVRTTVLASNLDLRPSDIVALVRERARVQGMSNSPGP